MELPKRKNIRLKGYDYNTPGWYFITICTKNKEKLLCNIVGTDVLGGPKIIFTQWGNIVDGQLEYITVETRYGELRYQEQWRDLIQVDVTDQDDVTNVVFKTLLNNTVVRLFQVTIGGDEDGAIGMLTGADGVSRNVYIVPFEQMDTSGLSEDEQNRLHAMFEEINYIVENLT